MNDVLLAFLILFSGFVPVSIALWYSNKVLNEAKNIHKMARGLYELGKKEREGTVNDVKKWMMGEEFGRHFKQIIYGRSGKDTQIVKEHIANADVMKYLPASDKKAMIDGATTFIADKWELSPKEKKGFKAVLYALFNRPSKGQKMQQDQMIRDMAQQYPIDPLQPVIPQIPEQF